MTPPLTQQQSKHLHHLYYDEKNFFGRDKLFKRLQQLDSSISRRQVQDWLNQQEVYQLFRPTRQSKNIQPTVLTKPYTQIGIDLMDMGKLAHNGYHWILTGIDLFTKKAWAIPLKNKEGRTVAAGMKKMLSMMIQTPQSLRSDNGSEFISQEFKNLLQSKSIKQVLSSPHLPQSNGQVERFNGILKRLININKTENDDPDWIAALPQLLNNYNQTYQRVIKQTPQEAEDNQSHEETYQEIKANAAKSHYLEPRPAQVGDTVRLKLSPEEGPLKFSRQKYVVDHIYHPRKPFISIYYKLKSPNGTLLATKYRRNDLLVIDPETQDRIKEPLKFEISRIVKPALYRGQPCYEIKWKHYPDSENTIEPRTQLMKDVPKMVERFDKEHEVKWFPNHVTYK